MNKHYPGHAKRVMIGIATDDDVDVCNMKDVIWTMTALIDPTRATLIVENTLIGCLDFASPVSGWGSRLT